MRWLDWAAERLVERNVTSNAVATLSLVLSFLAGTMLAATAFALAAVVMIAASLGDALDGRVARRARMVSPRGALVEAAGDRYQEFFLLAGIALAFRDSAWMLSFALLAILGSFMVTYSSVKAEALETPVPAGAMRRPERALVLGAGTVLTAVLGPITSRAGLTKGIAEIPLGLATLVIAFVANGSAIARLRTIAEKLAGPPQTR